MTAVGVAIGVRPVQGADPVSGAARAAAEAAVQHSGVNLTILDRALPHLDNADPDANLRSQVAALVEELDERAWTIQDQVDAGAQSQQDYFTAFAAARAAASVLAALDADPEQAALDSAYEAQAGDRHSSRAGLGAGRDRVLSGPALPPGEPGFADPVLELVRDPGPDLPESRLQWTSVRIPDHRKPDLSARFHARPELFFGLGDHIPDRIRVTGT